MRKIFSFIWEISKVAIIAALIVLPIRQYVFQPFFVKGQSMEPSFSNGDYLIIDEISYRFSDPQRGEVIVFNYPKDPTQRYIKRVIGLPGETIEVKDGKVMVFNREGEKVLEETDYLRSVNQTPGQILTTLEQDEYFVMGDNRDASSDSRSWGPLPKDYIIGKVFFRAFPMASVAKFELPEY